MSCQINNHHEKIRLIKPVYNPVLTTQSGRTMTFPFALKGFVSETSNEL